MATNCETPSPPSLDRLAFSQMMLAALSHDFVTPFRTAVDCCARISGFAGRSSIWSDSAIREVDETRAAIGRALFPKLTSLYNEAKIHEGSSPDRMVKVLVDRVGDEVEARLVDLRRVMSLADERNPNEVLTSTLNELQTATFKIATMMQGIKDIVRRPEEASGAHARSTVKRAVADAVEILQPLREDFEWKIVGDVVIPVENWKGWSIFSNLIGNAVKYSKDGERARVEVLVGHLNNKARLATNFRNKIIRDHVADKYYHRFVESLVTSGEWCEIQVTDYGIGIPAKRLWGIFKLFKQISEEPGYKTRRDVDVQAKMLEAFGSLNMQSPRAHMGVGLGLALTQYYIRSHGGEVAVSSKVSGPTTFGIWFPITTSDGFIESELRADVWWRQ